MHCQIAPRTAGPTKILDQTSQGSSVSCAEFVGSQSITSVVNARASAALAHSIPASTSFTFFRWRSGSSSAGNAGCVGLLVARANSHSSTRAASAAFELVDLDGNGYMSRAMYTAYYTCHNRTSYHCRASNLEL